MLTISLGLRTGSFGTSTYFDELRPYEFGVERRFSIFEEQGQDFTKIRVQLIKRFRLRVCPRKSGDESNEEPRFRRPFDNGCIGLHAKRLARRRDGHVAKMEAADPTVSVDLLVRSLLAAGANRRDLGRVVGSTRR
jgi:hypothetical protein